MITSPPASRRRGIPNPVREIGEAVGLRSPSTVHFHLKKAGGCRCREIGAEKATGHHPDSIRRAVRSVPEPEEPADRVPIVGNVAAGSPILAQECIEDYHLPHRASRGCSLRPAGPGVNPC